jgi:hypothetical protein
MSSGALKGIEVVLIAGLVGWFAYSQLRALKQDDTKRPPSKDTPSAHASGGTEDPAGDPPKQQGS